MKNLFALLAIAGLVMFAAPQAVMAQEDAATEMAADMSAESDSAVVDSAAVDSAAAAPAAVEEPAALAAEPVETREVLSFHQTVKKYFIEGGATFMAFVLICLILGLALSIERIIYLNMATTNSKSRVKVRTNRCVNWSIVPTFKVL